MVSFKIQSQVGSIKRDSHIANLDGDNAQPSAKIARLDIQWRVLEILFHAKGNYVPSVLRHLAFSFQTMLTKLTEGQCNVSMSVNCGFLEELVNCFSEEAIVELQW